MDSIDSRIPHKPDGYHDTGEHAYKQRSLADYSSMLFRDSTKDWLALQPSTMIPDNTMEWSMRHWHELCHYSPNPVDGLPLSETTHDWDWPKTGIFGGSNEFFSDGAQIIDLGSGHGRAVHEINERYKNQNIQCFGVDYRYHHDRPEKALNLVGANFEALPFADGLFNRLLSVESFPAWLPKDEKKVERYFDEITRVSSHDALWRGTLPTLGDESDMPTITHYDLARMFTQRGWEVVFDTGKNSFAARRLS